MNYTYNVTFVIHPDKENEFVDWLRSAGLELMFPAKAGIIGEPSVRKVVETGGEKPAPDHGLSIAVQSHFNSEMDVHKWQDNILPGALRSFHQRFAPECAFFTTLLQSVPV